MAFLIVGSVSVGAPSQQELLRSWMSENSVIHFSLDKKNNITKKHFIIIETKDLVKLYQARNFLPIWTDQDFQQKSIVKIAQEYMQTELLQHGLNPDDYLSYELNSLTLMSGDSQNWMYFEIMMSEAFLRMGKDLATGRLNFAQLEKEFKLKQVPFKLYDYLQSAMNAKTDTEFAIAIDKLAPQSTLYKKLRIVLAKLRGFLVNPEWLTDINLDTDIKYGFKNLNILRLRQRLNDLGYAVALGSPIFDDNFLVAVKEFQLLNGLLVDGIINKNGNFIHALNKNLKSRIEQVQINLERLRFLPRKMEAQYAFVNTAFAEFKLFEGDKTVLKFKTVVGKQTRRTPSKRDLIEEVILNPTWTVPISIFKKDKLDKIQTDVDYLKTHHIRVIGNNSIEYNPLDIDWSEVNVDSFPYQLVQQPGVNNSLGVVKFPLYKHADNIYLHDTNEKKFFEPEIYNRHKSSGCIRLEKPLELAEYLLKSSAETSWSLETLKTLVPPAHSGEDLISYQLKTSKALPVYLMYLTVDVGDNGELRFSDDIYGQDSRFMKLLNSTTKLDFTESISADQKMGSLLDTTKA
jgi:murein L,D-transpeptidase YcbB/YkuD